MFVLLAIVGNGQTLLWDLMSKINFFGVETKGMSIQTRNTAPKMFAKFGYQNRTFDHKKMEKVIAKLESDRL